MTGETWQRDEGWVGSEIDDSFVMVHIESGRYIALNPTANAIWNALETPRSAGEIEAVLRARFAVDEDACRAAVTRTLDEMRTLQLAAPR